jgi:uncharacterized protein YdaU (DUF1376 family)
MPLYVADYIADTAHLNATQSGAYLHLIMHYWLRGGLPNSEAMLKQITKQNESEWQANRDVLADLFGPGWTHERIDREIAKANEKYERRAAAGRKGGSSKGRVKSEGAENPEALLNQCSSNAEAGLNQLQLQLHKKEKKDISDAPHPPPNRVRSKGGYPEDFERWWSDFPTDPLMSKKEAAVQWAKLSEEDRAKAQQAIRPFMDYIAKQTTYRPVHACRFLSQRRFDGFTPKTLALPEGVPQFQTDAEFETWWANRRGAAQ